MHGQNQPQPGGQAGCPAEAGQHDHRQQRRQPQQQDHGHPQDAHGGVASHQPGVELGGDHHAHAVDGEHQRVLRRAQPVPVLEHKGRAHHVAHDHCHAEARDHGQGQELPVPQQHLEAAERAGSALGPAALRRQRFGHPAKHDNAQNDADQGQGQEHGPPVEQPGDGPADGRRQQRGKADDQHQPGEHGCRSGAGETVTDHGQGHHGGGRVEEALEQAQHNQGADVRGHEAQQRDHHVHADADDQRQPPAEAVRERADHQLPDGGTEQSAGEGELRSGSTGVQVRGNLRQRRQVHIRGDGGKGRQGAEHQDVLDAGACADAGTGGGRGAGFGRGIAH